MCSFLCAYLWWRNQSVRREHSDGWQESLVLRQSCSARLKSLVGCGCKKIHRFHVLIKAFLVKKKGTKTAVLSRVAKLRSVVALLHGWTKWSLQCDRTPQRLRNETDKSFSFRNRITLVFESCSRSLTIYSINVLLVVTPLLQHV